MWTIKMNLIQWISVVSLGFVNQGAIYLWLLHDFSHLQPFVCSSGWRAARICRWTGKMYFAYIAKCILHTLQNIYCIHCKIYIHSIPFAIFEWFENYVMYFCSTFFYQWGAIHTLSCRALRALCMNVLRIFCIKGKEEKEASALSHICRTVRFCHRPNRESEPRCFVSFLPLHFFTTPWLQQLLHWFWTFF